MELKKIKEKFYKKIKELPNIDKEREATLNTYIFDEITDYPNDKELEMIPKVLGFLISETDEIPRSLNTEDHRKLFLEDLVKLVLRVPSQWNEVDYRIVTLITLPGCIKKTGDTFYRVIAKEIKEKPEENIFDNVMQQLLKNKLSHIQILEGLIKESFLLYLSEGRPTSAGRYLESFDFEIVFETAKKLNRTLPVTRYFAYSENNAFDTYWQKVMDVFIEKKESFILSFLDMSLERNADRYKEISMDYLSKASDENSYRTLKILCKHYPQDYIDLKNKLAIKALKILENKESCEKKQGVVRQVLEYSDRVTEILSLYKEKNQAYRIKVYQMINDKLGKKGLSLLLDGLLYDFDESSIYGFITYKKYIKIISGMIRNFDIKDHVPRIWNYFLGLSTEDKSIKKDIAKLLSNYQDQVFVLATEKLKSTNDEDRRLPVFLLCTLNSQESIQILKEHLEIETVPQLIVAIKKVIKKPKKITPPHDSERYFFLQFAIDTAKHCLNAISEFTKSIDSPIHKVVISAMEGSYRVQFVELTTETRDFYSIETTLTNSNFPEYVEDEHHFMTSFIKRHGFVESDEEEIIELLRELYEWSIMKALITIRNNFDNIRKTIPISKEVYFGALLDGYDFEIDHFEGIEESILKRIGYIFNEIDEIEEFAMICFKEEKDQEWLKTGLKN